MILLDTNVVSEQMRLEPSSIVLKWFNEIDHIQLCLSSVTEAELRSGIVMMPNSKAKLLKAEKAELILRSIFKDRILPFESKSAVFYAEIFAYRKTIGRPISVLDCMIAAIARANGCKLATRNVADFEHCELEVINPWVATE